jgi:hypothetical protein
MIDKHELRRFPPPWSVDEADSKLDRQCFIVRDAMSRFRRREPAEGLLASALAHVLLKRPNPASTRRRSYSPATRPGASLPTSPSCRSWCVGPEHRATTRHSVISITLTAARQWQAPQRRAEGLLHCYLSPPWPRPRACRSAPVVGATPAQRLLFYVRRRGVCRWLGFC